MIGDLRSLLARLTDKPGSTPPVAKPPLAPEVIARPDFNPAAPVAVTPPPAPVEPDPVTPPVSVDPDPVTPPDPDPVEPDPVAPPVSVDPGPVTPPDPVDPEPVDPDPMDPEPVTPPVSVDPDPVTPPDPVEPDPVTPPPPTPPGPPIAMRPIEVPGGRVSVLELSGARPVASVEITGQPAFGHASVNPDHSIALVLSGTNGTGRIGLDYTVTYADGAREAFASTLDVARPTQEAGWGEGEHYMLEVGADGRVAVETGENHRDVYVSADRDALSRADIARMEGLAVRDIDRKWLIDHPEYGGSEAMALDTDAGMDVWYGITSNRAGPSSHWLRLEAGHEYDDLGRVIGSSVKGESALHPLHITSWGKGAPPVIDDRIEIYQGESEHVVFSGVTVRGGVMGLEGRNFLFDDVTFTGGEGIAFQNMDTVTIRDSIMEDITRAAPSRPDGKWDAGADRIGGLYVSDGKGMLIEDTFIHHNGWADGYNTGSGGQPPSTFSHNIYLQNSTTDATFRDNISAQASSFGAQFRGGAFIEDNAFIDNNASFIIHGGDYKGAGPSGNFSFVAGNLTTSAAYKPDIGSVSLGQLNGANDTTFTGNIVAHLADPDNPAEVALKLYSNGAHVGHEKAFFDDTIIYNWKGSWGPPLPRDHGAANVEGLDLDRLDDVTIQNYAAAVLGRSGATIDDLMDHLSDQGSIGPDAPISADDILRYFQDGFGIEAPDGSGPNRFVPEEFSDGLRWDNRANWARDTLPGAGEDVDLGGNRVAFGTLTARVGALDLGMGGALRATSGKLTVEDGIVADAAGGQLALDGAGQVWTDGARGGPLDIDVTGGRFANTGVMEGRLDLAVSDRGQAILGTDDDRLDLEGGRLHVDGSKARAGFDGDAGGTATLRMDAASELSFKADAGGLGRLGEFRSGAFGDAGDVRSGIDLGGATLRLDLGRAAYEGRYALLEADEIVGRFGTIEVAGLRSNQDLRFELDHETDAMSLVFGRAGKGTGQVSLDTLGDAGREDADADLWSALTEGQGSFDEASPEEGDDTELLLL